VSIGIATYKRGEDNVESLLNRADRALYASKERGRNRFSVDHEETVPRT
jgi:diguanylate cyclase (GGDEF)-like protein